MGWASRPYTDPNDNFGWGLDRQDAYPMEESKYFLNLKLTTINHKNEIEIFLYQQILNAENSLYMQVVSRVWEVGCMD